MTTDRRSTSPLDAELRRRLEPAPAAVARLLRRARGAQTPPRRVWRWAAALAGGALAAALAMVVPRQRDQPPAPPGPTGAPARLTISNLDGPLTVTTATGTTWIQLSPQGDP